MHLSGNKANIKSMFYRSQNRINAGKILPSWFALTLVIIVASVFGFMRRSASFDPCLDIVSYTPCSMEAHPKIVEALQSLRSKEIVDVSRPWFIKAKSDMDTSGGVDIICSVEYAKQHPVRCDGGTNEQCVSINTGAEWQLEDIAPPENLESQNPDVDGGRVEPTESASGYTYVATEQDIIACAQMLWGGSKRMFS